jgi:predicted enzyme related to lactoylglutathione lyase
MREDGKIDYVEFRGSDMAAIKAFYTEAFGWNFTDYGPAYAAFDQGMEGGFDTDTAPHDAPPLVVLYAHDLEAMLGKVTAAGGTITVPIYAFPGGRRFHFKDPAGTVMAIWSQPA